MLSEISHPQKDKYLMILLRCVELIEAGVKLWLPEVRGTGKWRDGLTGTKFQLCKMNNLWGFNV